MHFVTQILHRIACRCVQFEELLKQIRLIRVRNDIFLRVGFVNVQISNRCSSCPFSVSSFELERSFYIIADLKNETLGRKDSQIPSLDFGAVRVFMNDQIFSNEM